MRGGGALFHSGEVGMFELHKGAVSVGVTSFIPVEGRGYARVTCRRGESGSVAGGGRRTDTTNPLSLFFLFPAPSRFSDTSRRSLALSRAVGQQSPRKLRRQRAASERQKETGTLETPERTFKTND